MKGALNALAGLEFLGHFMERRDCHRRLETMYWDHLSSLHSSVASRGFQELDPCGLLIFVSLGMLSKHPTFITEL